MYRTAVILDTVPLWHEAVEVVLGRLDIRVAGKATSGGDAVELVREQTPDILLLDIDLGEGAPRGAAWIRRAIDVHPSLKVIVLSMRSDPADLDAAFEAGAAAYVFKTAHPEDVAAAIRQAFSVSMVLSPTYGRVAAAPAARAVQRSSDEVDPALTKREMEILQLVAEGHSNSELARMLWVTEQTVKFHLSNIYRKLDVANRTEASRWAQLRGLLPDRELAATA